jgi:hypothetical protein
MLATTQLKIFCLLSRNVRVKIHETVLCIVLCVKLGFRIKGRTHTEFGDRVRRIFFYLKGGGWGISRRMNLRNQELKDSSSIWLSRMMKSKKRQNI